jgi:hypothetical protein
MKMFYRKDGKELKVVLDGLTPDEMMFRMFKVCREDNKELTYEQFISELRGVIPEYKKEIDRRFFQIVSTISKEENITSSS